MLGLAVRVDGRRPMGARARRITEPELRLAVGPQKEEMTLWILCQSLEDLQDHCQPHAPGQGLDKSLWEGRVGFLCACMQYTCTHITHGICMHKKVHTCTHMQYSHLCT